MLVRVFGKPLKAHMNSNLLSSRSIRRRYEPWLLVETYRVEKQGDEIKNRQLLERSYCPAIQIQGEPMAPGDLMRHGGLMGKLVRQSHLMELGTGVSCHVSN